MVISLHTLVDQGNVVLHDVSWEFYEQISRELADRHNHITFDNGDLEIMAPVFLSHESWKSWIGQMIEIVCLERNIAARTAGEMTLGRKDLAKALQPDESYYIQTVSAVSGKKKINLKKDPPPDLAVEVDITRSSIPREPIYAALKVPELWRFNGKKLIILRLDSGQYRTSKSSSAFPFLPMAEFEKFLRRFETQPQTFVARAFRDWVKSLE